jgi:competence protein ComEC
MTHRYTPYLRFIVPFVLGLAAGGWMDQPVPYLGPVLFTGVLLAVMLAVRKIPYRFRWVFGAYLHLLLFFAGYFHCVAYNELRRPDHFAFKTAPGAQYLIGTVYKSPSHGAKLKVPVQVEAIGTSPDSMQPATGNLLLFLEITSETDSIRYGDRLGLYATPRSCEPPKNPYAFDYRRYLHFQNIHYQAFVKTDSLEVLSRNHGTALWRTAYRSRDRLLGLLGKYFPTADEYAVASALLVGYTDDLSEDLRTAYAQTGSMHALAVSGTHVGMLYVGLMFLLARFRLRGRWKLLETVLILAVIWAFTFLTGATASVLRASIMFSTYMLGKAFHRDAPAWNVLPASAFGLLLYNPYFLFDVGFQLSYAAVAGMVFFYARFYKLFPPMPRWADECLKVLLVGMAAQLGTLPLTLYYFNQFPVYFWLSGWIVVLGGAIFLWGGAVLVLLDMFSQTLAGWLGTALYYMLWGINKAIFFIQTLPGSVISNIWIAGWVVAVLYVCIGFLGSLMVYKKVRYLMACVATLSLLGVYRISTLSAKSIRHEITIYHVNKQSLIDFRDGRGVVSLSDTLAPGKELYTAQANRITGGMNRKTALHFAVDTFLAKGNLLIDGPFIQFYNKKLVVVDRAEQVRISNAIPVKTDILLLRKSPKITIAECREHFDFQVAVFDVSNSLRQTERWRRECEENGWRCYDVRSRGAAVIEVRSEK